MTLTMSRGRQMLSAIFLTGFLIGLASCSKGTAASASPTPVVEVATVLQRDTPIYTAIYRPLDEALALLG